MHLGEARKSVEHHEEILWRFELHVVDVGLQTVCGSQRLGEQQVPCREMECRLPAELAAGSSTDMDADVVFCQHLCQQRTAKAMDRLHQIVVVLGRHEKPLSVVS